MAPTEVPAVQTVASVSPINNEPKTGSPLLRVVMLQKYGNVQNFTSDSLIELLD